MNDITRLGLGCMGMNRSNKERSVETVRAALDAGITLLNTGEFYGQGESELVLGEALQGVPRDKYFVSVKFGMLPKLGGGMYGIDMNPKNIQAHLVYSLRRLNLDYIDLYEPARLDETIPVEDVVGEISRLVEAGYVRHIGLSMVRADTLRRAAKVAPIHTVEMEYSLANRSIERGLIAAAKETDTRVLAFGAFSHGRLNEEAKPAAFRALKELADEKQTTVHRLALAWTLAKYPAVTSLVGTTNATHMQDAIDALSLTLSADDIQRMEAAFPENTDRAGGMRAMRFVGGEIVWGK